LRDGGINSRQGVARQLIESLVGQRAIYTAGRVLASRHAFNLIYIYMHDIWLINLHDMEIKQLLREGFQIIFPVFLPCYK